MKPAKAKELLNCSYTTLHNYVKSGKILLAAGISGKQQNYDDASVYALCESRQVHENTVSVVYKGKRYDFRLPDEDIIKILNYIGTCLQTGIE